MEHEAIAEWVRQDFQRKQQEAQKPLGAERDAEVFYREFQRVVKAGGI